MAALGGPARPAGGVAPAASDEGLALPPLPGTDRPPPIPEGLPAELLLERVGDPQIEVAPPADPAVEAVGCASCAARGHLHGFDGPGAAGCAHGCGGGPACLPGRKPCYPWEAHTFVGRFFGNLYECLCCPDPCYQPSWIPEANAAFFTDFARPQTLQRFRWDRGLDMTYPDRAEFFLARADGRGRGPMPPHVFPDPSRAAKHPHLMMGRSRQFKSLGALNFNELALYNEAAAERASFFFEVIYRTIDPLYDFKSGNKYLGHAAGFSNINLGTKALLLDCELMQLTFQFKTYLPIGQASKGLTNGLVALEPSLLMTVRLAPETFFQGQLAEWIPLSGDPDYAGATLRYTGSINHVLYRCTPDVPLIGTFEFAGWSFQDGAFTDPLFGHFRSASGTYFNLGPGLRMSVCNRVDFGAGALWSVSDAKFADPLLRAEMRILY